MVIRYPFDKIRDIIKDIEGDEEVEDEGNLFDSMAEEDNRIGEVKQGDNDQLAKIEEDEKDQFEDEEDKKGKFQLQR